MWKKIEKYVDDRPKKISEEYFRIEYSNGEVSHKRSLRYSDGTIDTAYTNTSAGIASKITKISKASKEEWCRALLYHD